MYDLFISTILAINNSIPWIWANVIPFLLLIGVVVIFHELGHFLVAKFFGIRVEEFSIGFPPKLFGKKIGDTEYVVSLLPVGGYVKLAGQDDFGKQKVDVEDKGMYYSKPAWQRFLVVLAGPLANFIIGWILFTIIFTNGVNVEYNPAHPGKIGNVFENSAAYEAGLQAGDEILQVGEKKITSWNDLLELSVNPQADEYAVLIKRNNEILTKTITPRKSGKRYLFGISQFAEARIGVITDKENTIARTKELQPNDLIISLDGAPINQWMTLEEYFFLNPEKKINTAINRNNALISTVIQPKLQKIEGAGFIDVELKKINDGNFILSTVIDKVNSAALSAADILAGDKIISLIKLKPSVSSNPNQLNEEYTDDFEYKINSGLEFIRFIANYPDAHFAVVLERDGNTVRRAFKTEKKTIEYGMVSIEPMQYIERYGLIQAFIKSLEKSKDFIVQTFQVIGKIISNKMQASDVLGGPITMWKMTVITAEAGYQHFLMLMAIISINLGFINLLPIPVIDGGHLVIYIYEMFSGKMPSEKALNWIQQAGLVIVLSLMIFTFYIDIVKMF